MRETNGWIQFVCSINVIRSSRDKHPQSCCVWINLPRHLRFIPQKKRVPKNSPSGQFSSTFFIMIEALLWSSTQPNYFTSLWFPVSFLRIKFFFFFLKEWRKGILCMRSTSKLLNLLKALSSGNCKSAWVKCSHFYPTWSDTLQIPRMDDDGQSI